jgi:hypothetical protein
MEQWAWDLLLCVKDAVEDVNRSTVSLARFRERRIPPHWERKMGPELTVDTSSEILIEPRANKRASAGEEFFRFAADYASRARRSKFRQPRQRRGLFVTPTTPQWTGRVRHPDKITRDQRE